MNRTVAIILLVAGVLLLSLGLLFLCAASQVPGRLPIALALVVVGVALVAWSGTTLRRRVEEGPERVADRTVELVRRRGDDEITLADVVGSLGVSHAAAEAGIAELMNRQLVQTERREGRDVYVFPQLRAGKMIRKCVYCGSEFSVKTPLQKCPNCGGKLEIVRK